VQAGKRLRFGERGPFWWDDGAPDVNPGFFTPHPTQKTPYADWWRSLPSD